MPVQLLSQSHYRGAAIVAPDEVGLTTGTHVAAIDFDGSPCTAYVKFCLPHELLNELIGYLIARRLQLLQPQHAAVVVVPLKQARDAGVVLPPWMPPDLELYPAWCTSELGGKSIRYIYKFGDIMARELRSMFADCSQWYSNVTAFDEWVCNNDRNAGNIIQISPRTWAIIDHGMILGGRQIGAEIAVNIPTNNKLRAVIQADRADNLDRLHNKMVASASHHRSAFVSAQASLSQWLDMLDKNTGHSVLHFLHERSSENWMADRIGVI